MINVVAYLFGCLLWQSSSDEEETTLSDLAEESDASDEEVSTLDVLVLCYQHNNAGFLT